MFILFADKARLSVRQRELVTSGSVHAYTARFEFSEDWAGLARTAVFRSGKESRSVLLDGDNEVKIPWEVLREPAEQLLCGVCGVRDGEEVLPTVWTSLGVIHEGAAPGEGAGPPTPDLWRQELAGKGDRLGRTGAGELGLYAGERLLSTVPVPGSEGGTADHRLLSHRDAEGQHPIGAVTGLAQALDRIPEPAEAITNAELEEMLK